MSYYTDKILANYNKGKTNYDYGYDDDSEEEESEEMTEEYDEDNSNENFNRKYSYGGGYANLYGSQDKNKNKNTNMTVTPSAGGISKYLNPGKLMSSSQGPSASNVFSSIDKKTNPYAKSVNTGYDPYKNDTYNIDIDLNKIKKESEKFQTRTIDNDSAWDKKNNISKDNIFYDKKFIH